MPTTTKKRKKRIDQFEGECPRCHGSGLWNNRPGYPCRGCDATGRVQVAIMQEPSGSAKLLVISAKGNVTKERYDAKAELTQPLDRYGCGSTVGSGWRTWYTSTDPVGAPCAVYAVQTTGELSVALPRGGYSSTGKVIDHDDDREPTTVAVKVVEPEAAAAIERVRERIAAEAEEERAAEQADEQNLARWRSEGASAMSTLDLRSATHAAQRAEDGAAERELAEVIDAREARGDTG